MSRSARFLARSLRAALAQPPATAPQPPRGVRWHAADAASRVSEVRSDAEHAEALRGSGLVVTDYTAAWCGPCRFVAPQYELLAAKHVDVTFLKVDIDLPAVAATVAAARVSAPTFTFHRDGKLVGEVRGADVAAVRDAIASHSGA